MSKHVKHVPKHRAAPPRHTLAKAPRKALRTTVILSSVAVAATGATIAGGLVGDGPSAVTNAAADADTAAEAGEAVIRTENLAESDPRDIARALLEEFGFGLDQFGCLDSRV